jgi:hypothetical protein
MYIYPNDVHAYVCVHPHLFRHSYDILGVGILWKPKDLHKIRQNSLKFTPEECYDKVLNEEFLKNLFCKMKNVITRYLGIQHGSFVHIKFMRPIYLMRFIHHPITFIYIHAFYIHIFDFILVEQDKWLRILTSYIESWCFIMGLREF